MPSLKQPPSNFLYAITDCQNLTGSALFTAVKEIVAGGCTLIQYRNKSGDAALCTFEAEHVKQICHRHNAKLIINDSIELAQHVQADGVHLGQTDGSISLARKALGDNAIIGITCHDSLEYAEIALEQGANYVAFGRFFLSKTKATATNAPISLLKKARTLWPSATLVAIGGITQNNAQPLLSYGADYVAVSHDVFYSQNKMAYAKNFDNKDLL